VTQDPFVSGVLINESGSYLKEFYCFLSRSLGPSEAEWRGLSYKSSDVTTFNHCLNEPSPIIGRAFFSENQIERLKWPALRIL
jgi:hypothetical protein